MTPIEKKIIEIRDKEYPKKEKEDFEYRMKRIAFVEGMQSLAKQLEQMPSEEEIRVKATNYSNSPERNISFRDGARFASTFKVKEQ